LLADSSLLLSALEGKQIAKGEKVAALVPRVEKESEIRRVLLCRILQPLKTQFHLRTQRAGAIYSSNGIDFVRRVGYANKTFAARPRINDWGNLPCNGQHQLLKKFASTAKSTHTPARSFNRNSLP
jgi:hypothetical protein